jgi:hypothetical protein
MQWRSLHSQPNLDDLEEIFKNRLNSLIEKVNKYKKVTKPVPKETKKDVVKMVELNKAGKGKVSGSLGPENPESTDEDKDLHLDPSMVSYKL